MNTDLDAITARLDALGGEATIEEYSDHAAEVATDARALVAEVRRLRKALADAQDRPWQNQ